jgi:large subunit ribosomal protein L7/L12
MAETPIDDMIKKIEEVKKKRDQYNAKLQQLETRMNEKRKKEDTRRKILVGAFVLDKLDKGDAISINSDESLSAEMDQFLTRKSDRAMFGLKTQEADTTETESLEAAEAV